MIVGAKTLLLASESKLRDSQDHGVSPACTHSLPGEAWKDTGADAHEEPESRRGSKQSQQSRSSSVSSFNSNSSKGAEIKERRDLLKQIAADSNEEPESRRGSKQSQQSGQSRCSSISSLNSSSSKGAEVKERDRVLEKERRDLLKQIGEHYAVGHQLPPVGLNKAGWKELKEHWDGLQ